MLAQSAHIGSGENRCPAPTLALFSCQNGIIPAYQTGSIRTTHHVLFGGHLLDSVFFLFIFRGYICKNKSALKLEFTYSPKSNVILQATLLEAQRNFFYNTKKEPIRIQNREFSRPGKRKYPKQLLNRNQKVE